MLKEKLVSATSGRNDGMKILNSFKGLKNEFPNIVVGLGNFDGVHIGHQRLIKEVVETAADIGGTAVICTFFPHPTTILDPQNVPLMLMSQQNKEQMMAKLGVDVVVLLPFNKEFAQITAEDFIQEILFNEMNVQRVVVGYNYTFGRRGQGTIETLNKHSNQYNYKLQVIAPVSIEGQVVSSTHIRNLLSEGNVDQAAKFLGYRPCIEGWVVTGDRRGGNTLGFPTANLNLDEKMLAPANGVYSVHVELRGEVFLGVANVGTKPTFNGHGHRNLEVHLLDFNADIYGEKITVKFLRRLRNEKRFNSAHDLVSQINQDIQMALQDRV